MARRLRGRPRSPRRALQLTRPIRLDVHLELDLEVALIDVEKAAAVAEAAAERARAVGDETGDLLARTVAAFFGTLFAVDPDVDELNALAHDALPLLEQAPGDHAGLVTWMALGYGVANCRGRLRDLVLRMDEVLEDVRRRTPWPSARQT